MVVASLVDPSRTGPAPSGPFGLVGVDTYLHVLGYAVLGLLVSRALRLRSWQAAILAVAVPVGVGAGVEVAQTFVPARTASFSDAATNAVGAVLGLLCWSTLETLRRR